MTMRGRIYKYFNQDALKLSCREIFIGMWGPNSPYKWVEQYNLGFGGFPGLDQGKTDNFVTDSRNDVQITNPLTTTTLIRTLFAATN